MPAHPDFSVDQAMIIAHWIVDHGDDPGVSYHIGNEGSFSMDASGVPGPRAGMMLTAAYTGALKSGDTRVASNPRARIMVGGVPVDGH